MAQIEEADDARESVSGSSKPKSNISARGAAAKDTEATNDENEKEEGDEEDGEEDEEEYEIEAILDTKRGVFKKGEQAYLVKWKGYGSEHNSWVTEEDARNAKDLINEFLAQKAREKEQSSRLSARGRKPASAKISKGAKTTTPDTESVSASTTKRGRGKAATPSESEEEEPRKAKKHRGGHPNGSSAAKRGRLASLDRTDDEDVAMVDVNGVGQEGRDYKSMKELKLHTLKNWEDVVKSIMTIEQSGPELLVFFELTDGRSVREPASICRKKFPQKLIDFYESHLKWRTAEDVQSD